MWVPEAPEKPPGPRTEGRRFFESGFQPRIPLSLSLGGPSGREWIIPYFARRKPQVHSIGVREGTNAGMRRKTILNPRAIKTTAIILLLFHLRLCFPSRPGAFDGVCRR